MSEAYLRKVELLRGQYIAEMPQDIERLRTLVKLIREGTASDESWELLHRVLHDNAGNAGMLSFARLEALFREALAPLEEAYPSARPTDPEALDRIAGSIDKIAAEGERLHEDLGL